MPGHHFHLRVTPHVDSYDLSGWINDFNPTRWVIAKEAGSITFKPHYHIYVETESPIVEKTLRNRVTKAFDIPTGKRGVSNKYYALKIDCYKDPSPAYLLKDVPGQLDPGNYRGYSPAEISEFMIEGRKQFPPKPVRVLSDVDLNVTGDLNYSNIVENDQPAKGKTEWTRLLDKFEDLFYSDEYYRKLNMSQIRDWIVTEYVGRRLPPPRTGDQNRYAQGLWMICHSKVELRDMGEVNAHKKSYLDI